MKLLNEANFQESVKEGTVLADFWTPWCRPCNSMTPVLEKLSQEYEGKAVIGKVNADENPDLVSEYQVNAVPTFLLFKDGRLVKRVVGLQNEQDLRRLLDS